MRRNSYCILMVVVTILLIGGVYAARQAALPDHARHAPTSSSFRLAVPASQRSPQSASSLDLPVFRVVRGQTVTLIISSQTPGSVHVHGYEKSIALTPGGNATLTFVADSPGRFPVHLHDPDGAMHGLAVLEVQPR
jgi:FtsP/CotA-like multicopper oxidase with cupredoxin domain